MSAYVKIKRSKNLRFKLISLMYLVFLMLSLIQIPTDWLASNAFIYPYLNYPKTSYDAEMIQVTAAKLKAIEPQMHVALGVDSITKAIKEPNAYAPTDMYFIKNGQAEPVFNALIDLKDWVNNVNTDSVITSNFAYLFEEDLKNGLQKNNLKSWQNWKWKHVPVTMAVNLFEEIKLRIDLLAAAVQPIDKNSSNEETSNVFNSQENPKLVLLSENGKLRIGETLKFHLYADSLVDLKIRKNNVVLENQHQFNSDTVLFKPTQSGNYTIDITGTRLHEVFDVNVVPASILSDKNSTLRIAYKGIQYKQSLPTGLNSASLYVNGLNKGKIESSKQLNFVPNQIGWNVLELKSANNVLLLDSIYVKPLPEPYVLIEDLPNFSISKKRLEQQTTLKLFAIHPSFDKQTYQIESFEYEIPGTSINSDKVQGALFPVTEALKKSNVSYIIFSKLVIKQGNESKTLTEPIVVKIL